MNFTFTEEQQAIQKLARQILEAGAAKERLEELEQGEVRFDADLWSELAAADLLGLAIPEAFGGSGYSFLEACVFLAEVGWTVAPVPAYSTLVGAAAVARFGTEEQRRGYLPGIADGTLRLSPALSEEGRSDPTAPATTATREGAAWRIRGAKRLVPAAQLSDHLLVPAAESEDTVGLFVVDMQASGVDVHPVVTTNGEPFADVTLACTAEALGDEGAGREAVEGTFALALAGLAALQVGVSDRALRIAADYTKEREQFGRPIGSFQAVQQRMADAFIDVEAIRWTAFYAAWLLAEGRPALRESAIAKVWAGEAGARVAATTQQVHGGIGIDITYPLFRYTLWAKQIELTLGAPASHLAWLGASYTQETE